MITNVIGSSEYKTTHFPSSTVIAKWHPNQQGPLHVEMMTKRLIIRSIALSDLENCIQLFGSRSMDTYCEGVIRSVEKTRKYVEARCQRWQENKPLSSFIILTRQGEFVGHADFDETDNDSEAELGYILTEKQQGKGYARECARAMVYDYLPALRSAGYLPIKSVIATVKRANQKSIDILQMLNMKYVCEVQRYEEKDPRLLYRLKIDSHPEFPEKFNL